MVRLGDKKRAGRAKLGNNGRIKYLLSAKFGNQLLRHPLLCGIVIKNDRSILAADIIALAVKLRWVMQAKKHQTHQL